MRQAGDTCILYIESACCAASVFSKFDGGLLRLHEADEAAVDWLTHDNNNKVFPVLCTAITPTFY